VSGRIGLLSGCRGVVIGVSTENGIGYQLVKEFIALGADVAATYRPARRRACAALLEAAGVQHHAVLEANDESSIEKALGEIGAAFGQLDFVVHTLVHVPEGLLLRPLLSASRAEVNSVMDASAYSLIAICRQAVPWLERSPHPRVVTLTSTSATRATPNYHVAGVAKAALGGVALYLASELGRQGILCNAVAFSMIDTDSARRAVRADNVLATRAYLANRSLTRRALEHGHVTRAAAFFASPLCQNITGEVLTVDGGYSRGYLG
jgi:enoyl-[acyl-carrier protein] reductase I